MPLSSSPPAPIALLSLLGIGVDALLTATTTTTILSSRTTLTRTVNPASASSLSPAPTSRSYALLGCFAEPAPDLPSSALYGEAIILHGLASLTVPACIARCQRSKRLPILPAVTPYYPFAAVSNGSTCVCSLHISRKLDMVSPAFCATPCNGDHTVACGGDSFALIYSIMSTNTATSSLLFPSVSLPSAVTHSSLSFSRSSPSALPHANSSTGAEALRPADFVVSPVSQTTASPMPEQPAEVPTFHSTVAIVLTVTSVLLLGPLLFFFFNRCKKRLARTRLGSSDLSSWYILPSRQSASLPFRSTSSFGCHDEPDAESTKFGIHPPASARRPVDWARLNPPPIRTRFPLSPSLDSLTTSAVSFPNTTTLTAPASTSKRRDGRAHDQSSKARIVLGLDTAHDDLRRRYSASYPPAGSATSVRRASLQGDYSGVRIGPSANISLSLVSPPICSSHLLASPITRQTSHSSPPPTKPPPNPSATALPVLLASRPPSALATHPAIANDDVVRFFIPDWAEFSAIHSGPSSPA